MFSVSGECEGATHVRRSSEYECAFEAYLQHKRLCYVAVDEHRRPLLDDAPVKSLDFIVFGAQGARLVVDVKGRRFPSGKPERLRRIWECWATRDDIEGLDRWARLWGPEFRGLLVFAYHILPSVELPDDTEDVWLHRGRRYLLRGIDAHLYRTFMRIRSPRWGTVSLPTAVFRSLVQPLSHFTQVTPCFGEQEDILGP
jgi:hypothetical protein